MSHTPKRSRLLPVLALPLSLHCGGATLAQAEPVTPDVVLTDGQTHTKFSAAIPPAARVASGAVVEAFTHEATGGQLHLGSSVEDLASLDFDRIHTLTGPVYVEGAAPGDVLAVTLLEVEPGDWGWTAVTEGFGFLDGEGIPLGLKTYAIDREAGSVAFTDGVRIPLAPFPGVMGVAPPPEAGVLSTIPPRANGGNMDDPHLVEGVTVYFPVFVEGALFSVGDGHAMQGLGEVCGTAVEIPMRIVYRVEVLKDARPIAEPQYETDEYYATTGFSTTIDEAAKKATRYMIEHIMAEHGLTETEAYMLCSLAGDLHIAETVDIPHMLVTMHVPKGIFRQPAE